MTVAPGLSIGDEIDETSEEEDLSEYDDESDELDANDYEIESETVENAEIATDVVEETEEIDSNFILHSNEDENNNLEAFQNAYEKEIGTENPIEIEDKEEKWLIVKFLIGRWYEYYVGRVLSTAEDIYEIECLRKTKESDNMVFFLRKKDINSISADQIKKILLIPKETPGMVVFDG